MWSQPTPPGHVAVDRDAGHIVGYVRTGPVSPETVPAGFAAAIAADPAGPLLTWYDDATGDRAELSGATLANWVAKTANLLVDDCGLGRGDAAVVDAPPHWQTAAVLLGCWSAGLGLGTGSPDVVFAAAGRTGRYPGAQVYGLGLAPLAAPMRDPVPGVADYVLEVRGHGDRFDPAAPVDPADPATGLTHAQLCRAAAGRATALGITAGDRVLIETSGHPDPLDWLLAPLLAGASVVLCASLDPAALAGRITAERVSVTLTG
jgi:uncharacterized protein (TIGR03089 family)